MRHMPTQQDRQGQGEPSPERRRSKRVPLSFHIQVSGFDRKGQFFRDLTVTLDVSEGGCQFELTREVDAKAPITIQVVQRDGDPPPGSKPLLFEVARTEPGKIGCIIGAMQLQSENIWRMSFPPNRARKLSR